ncbi:hypothetical protein Pme01_55630 [Planosporangium mesophilum]|uniref:Uncharacterized protein n=1 Tax=Planosporangium mesophilum TaxID=689768 RepID=A0A8J3THY5_9ACTN|nr:hypothetical protein Pme01_55630 [Planosporangium mesophilum]
MVTSEGVSRADSGGPTRATVLFHGDRSDGSDWRVRRCRGARVVPTYDASFRGPSPSRSVGLLDPVVG